MKSAARLRSNLWLESDQGMLLGMGRYMLLERVHSLGSLKRAAWDLGMSYRAAWGKMKQSEEALGAPLIEKQGSNRTGYRLTPLGKLLMDGYKSCLDEVEAFALERLRSRLGWPIVPYVRR